MKIAVVPTLSVDGTLALGEQRGFFKKEGLKLDITPVDSGPSIISGLAAGEYDLGFTAYAPVLLALEAGQKLQLVANGGNTGPAGTNGDIIVRKDSGITSYRQLSGKTLAVNAARSQLVLEAQGAIAAAGGNGEKLTPVQLPFNEVGAKVASGQVQAGAILQPFQSVALAKYSDLRSLGDPVTKFLKVGSPQGGLTTSAATAKSESAMLKKFKAAWKLTVAYANRHLTEVRVLGAKAVDMTAALAAKIPMQSLATTSAFPSAADFKPLINAMVKFKWLKAAPNLKDFLAQ